MSLSKIVVSGRVIRAPEKRFTPSTNVAVTEFAIAVESAPRADGATETAAVKIVTWRDLAERCAQEIKKGDLVAVDGRLQINNYQAQDGSRKRDVEIDAIAVENLTAAVGGSSSSSEDFGGAAEPKLARAGAKSGGPKANKSEDLDAIFASEDEIPF
ncbi:MAG TPA: single-stranded DNA-binding protein [Drouetiella sp.]|jgi:single-strand DNA-binding protein